MHPTPGKLYRHFKGGYYKVIGTATHSEDQTILVVYCHMDDGSLWARPLDLWDDVTDRWPDGVRRPRFVLHEKAPDIFNHALSTRKI